MFHLKRVDIGVLRLNHRREVAPGGASFVWVLKHNLVAAPAVKAFRNNYIYFFNRFLFEGAGYCHELVEVVIFYLVVHCVGV